ncbi:Uncharacterised protein [Vibrio cholerae]|nr:Uncharacterised protein [Vibrio cholerae]
MRSSLPVMICQAICKNRKVSNAMPIGRAA